MMRQKKCEEKSELTFIFTPQASFLANCFLFSDKLLGVHITRIKAFFFLFSLKVRFLPSLLIPGSMLSFNHMEPFGQYFSLVCAQRSSLLYLWLYELLYLIVVHSCVMAFLRSSCVHYLLGEERVSTSVTSGQTWKNSRSIKFVKIKLRILKTLRLRLCFFSFYKCSVLFSFDVSHLFLKLVFSNLSFLSQNLKSFLQNLVPSLHLVVIHLRCYTFSGFVEVPNSYLASV